MIEKKEDFLSISSLTFSRKERNYSFLIKKKNPQKFTLNEL